MRAFPVCNRYKNVFTLIALKNKEIDNTSRQFYFFDFYTYVCYKLVQCGLVRCMNIR